MEKEWDGVTSSARRLAPTAATRCTPSQTVVHVASAAVSVSVVSLGACESGRDGAPTHCLFCDQIAPMRPRHPTLK